MSAEQPAERACLCAHVPSIPGTADASCPDCEQPAERVEVGALSDVRATILGAIIEWVGESPDLDDCRSIADHLAPVVERTLTARHAALLAELTSSREALARIAERLDVSADKGREDIGRDADTWAWLLAGYADDIRAALGEQR